MKLLIIDNDSYISFLESDLLFSNFAKLDTNNEFSGYIKAYEFISETSFQVDYDYGIKYIYNSGYKLLNLDSNYNLQFDNKLLATQEYVDNKIIDNNSQTIDIKRGWNIGLTGLVKTNKTYGNKLIYEGILTSPLLSGGDTNFISGSNLTLLECNLLESNDGNIFYPVDIKQYNLRYYNSYNWRFTANSNKYYLLYIKAM